MVLLGAVCRVGSLEAAYVASTLADLIPSLLVDMKFVDLLCNKLHEVPSILLRKEYCLTLMRISSVLYVSVLGI